MLTSIQIHSAYFMPYIDPCALKYTLRSIHNKLWSIPIAWPMGLKAGLNYSLYIYTFSSQHKAYSQTLNIWFHNVTVINSAMLLWHSEAETIQQFTALIFNHVLQKMFFYLFIIWRNFFRKESIFKHTLFKVYTQPETCFTDWCKTLYNQYTNKHDLR